MPDPGRSLAAVLFAAILTVPLQAAVASDDTCTQGLATACFSEGEETTPEGCRDYMARWDRLDLWVASAAEMHFEGQDSCEDRRQSRGITLDLIIGATLPGPTPKLDVDLSLRWTEVEDHTGRDCRTGVHSQGETAPRSEERGCPAGSPPDPGWGRLVH